MEGIRALKVGFIRSLETTAKGFALEMGISLEAAKRVLAYARDPKTPENSLAILSEVKIDGQIIGPGNRVYDQT